MRRSHRFWLLLLAQASVGLSLSAQQGMVRFHNFKSPPAGQYKTTATATRNGTPTGPPMTQTVCVSQPTPEYMASMSKVANLTAATCKMSVLRDEPAVAEYEQVCAMGPTRQVMHSTLHLVDPKTVAVDTQMKMPGAPAGTEIDSHTTATYVGACTAAQLSQNQQSLDSMKGGMPPPSAEDCAQLPEARQQMQQALASCSSMPGDYVANCQARAKAASQMLEMEEQACRKR